MKERVSIVLRDNAQAMEESWVSCLGCVAHTLQLTVNKGVLGHRSISDRVFNREEEDRAFQALST